MLRPAFFTLLAFATFVYGQSELDVLKEKLAKTTALLTQEQQKNKQLQSKLDKQSGWLDSEILQEVEKFENYLNSLNHYIEQFTFPRDIYYLDEDVPKTNILGIMDWFNKKFREKLRGTLSDIIVSVRTSKISYSELEKKILKNPLVKACAPHLKSLVLIGTGSYYVSGMVIGIDYKKEMQVNKFREYLVTPYDQKKTNIDNLIRRANCKISWEVIGEYVFAKEKFPPGKNILCKKITKFINIGSTRNNYIIYTFNDATPPQIIFIEDDLPIDIDQTPKLSPTEKLKWQKIFNNIAKSISSNDLDKCMRHFSLQLRTSYSMQLDSPFNLPEGIKNGRPLIMGYELMRQLGLRYGDEIVLMTGKRQSGVISSIDRKFICVGAFRSGWQEVDSRYCYVQRKDLQGFIDWKSDISEVFVSVKNMQDVDKVKQQLQKDLYDSYYGGLYVEKWQDRRRTLLSAIEMEREVAKKVVAGLDVARRLCKKVRSGLSHK